MSIQNWTRNLSVIITSGINGGGLRACFGGIATALVHMGAKVSIFASLGEQYSGLGAELQQSNITVVQDRVFEMSTSDMRRQASHILIDYVTSVQNREYTWEMLGGSVREALVFRMVRRELHKRGSQVFASIQYYSMKNQSRLWPLFYLVGANTYRFTVDHVFAACEAERRKLTKSGFPSSRCSVAHLPISPVISADGLRPSQALMRLLDQIQGGPCITFLGNFDPAKGQDDLVRMMPYLLPEHPQLKLVLAGEGLTLDACRRRAVSLGAENAVLFPGRLPQSDVPLLLRACTMAVVPSRAETFGYCITEPLLLGVPVVSIPVGVAGELASLHAIRTFRRGDYKGAAMQVAAYLHDPDSARSQASIGQDYVARTCSPSSVANTMIRVWEAMNAQC